jgi:signal transduction histidine kinase
MNCYLRPDHSRVNYADVSTESNDRKNEETPRHFFGTSAIMETMPPKSTPGDANPYEQQCRELLEQQQQAVERLDLLAEIANDLLLTSQPEQVVRSVFQKISAHLGLEVYINYLLDTETQRLKLNSFCGVPEKMVERMQELELGESFCGVAAQQRARMVAEDIQVSSDRNLAIAGALGITAYACYPLLADGRLIGTLSFGTRKRTKFQREELAMMETVANQVAVAIDRKRTEEALQELNQALEGRVQERTNQLQESADQMEAFSYTISHDLRAPLRTIRGFSQALLEDYSQQLDDVGKDYLNRLMGGVDRMDVLIQDLLAYSRLGRAKLTFESIGLQQCLENVLPQFEEEVRTKEAKIIVRPPLALVLGHPPTLEQAIVNVLSNALKFVEPGTKPHVTIWSAETDGIVRLWMEDNGIGIAPEHQTRIFRVFERLHGMETYPGTGIGLAIVAKAVSRMGGRVGVESALGQGSRFWIDLPKAAAVSE